jgi:2-aminoethylphosphonate transport system substrate-binding protein
MQQNPNVKVFWPAGPDGTRSTFALPYYIGLVEGAPHADAGKKLIDFLLSQEAQTQISAIAQGMPSRQDVHPTDANFTNLHKMMEGVTVWSPDWTKVLNELQADVARWHEATGS